MEVCAVSFSHPTYVRYNGFIAIGCMLMILGTNKLLLCINTALVMDVTGRLLLIANKYLFLVITIICMYMAIITQLVISANQLHFVTAIAMLMLFDATPGCLLHGNRRQNQCVDRAEHHHTGQARHNLVPAFPSLMCLSIFLCALQSILLHIPITILPISMLQSQAGARPGIQFFQQSVHRRHSQPLCCGNPPK